MKPLPNRLDGAGKEALARIQAQARIQVRGERVGRTISERVAPARDRDDELVPNRGLLMLPDALTGRTSSSTLRAIRSSAPRRSTASTTSSVSSNPGRLDADGQPGFHAIWSIEDGTVTTGAERRTFEAFIDLVMDRLESDPKLHIYHYASYEPTAVSRLAGRYGTRGEEVDQLLRRRGLRRPLPGRAPGHPGVSRELLDQAA